MSDSRPGASLNGLLSIAAGRVTSLLLELAIEHEVFAKLRGRSVPLAPRDAPRVLVEEPSPS